LNLFASLTGLVGVCVNGFSFVGCVNPAAWLLLTPAAVVRPTPGVAVGVGFKVGVAIGVAVGTGVGVGGGVTYGVGSGRDDNVAAGPVTGGVAPVSTGAGVKAGPGTGATAVFKVDPAVGANCATRLNGPIGFTIESSGLVIAPFGGTVGFTAAARRTVGANPMLLSNASWSACCAAVWPVVRPPPRILLVAASESGRATGVIAVTAGAVRVWPDDTLRVIGPWITGLRSRFRASAKSVSPYGSVINGSLERKLCLVEKFLQIGKCCRFQEYMLVSAAFDLIERVGRTQVVA
jgi:hypothetical protein